MLSRVAENLYWMSRYVERAENIARLLDNTFQLELDAGLEDDGGPVDSVLDILTCRPAFEAQGQESSKRDAVLRFLTFDRAGQCSILAMVAVARENARGTQESLSAEAWSQVNRLYLYLSSPQAQRRFLASPFRFFDGVKRACILFDGLIDSTLPRGEVFHFLQLGRYLERIDMVSRILVSNLRHAEAAGPALHGIQWASLLRSCSAYEAFLRQSHDEPEPEVVLRFLLLDGDFPRATRFCLARCLESMREIAGAADDEGYKSQAERLLGRLDSELRYLDPDEILQRGLPAFLASIQVTCGRVGEEVSHAFFLN